MKPNGVDKVDKRSIKLNMIQIGMYLLVGCLVVQVTALFGAIWSVIN